jgi:tetratricopeptide (TPR) repeat protein
MSAIDDKALTKLWKRSTDLNNPNRHKAMFDLAFYLWNNNEHDDAVAVAGGLIDALADERGSSLWVEATRLKSLALHDSARDEEAIEAILEAIEFADVIANSLDYAFMQWHLADCYRTTLQEGLQEAAYRKAINGFAEAGHEYFQGQALFDLGALLASRMRYAESRENLTRAVPLLEAHGRTEHIILTKYKLAFVERKLGDLHVAIGHAQDAMRIAEFSNDLQGQRESQIELANIHSELGNNEIADDLLKSLIEDNDVKEKRETAAKALYSLGQHQLRNGSSDARGTLESAVPLLKAVGLKSLAQYAELSLLHQR